MENDRKYALKMIETVATCAKPRSFKEFQLMLDDYNIIIKNDGNIEVVTCGDADYAKMKREQDKLRGQQAAWKESIKERIRALKSVIYGRYIYENNRLKLLSYDECDKSFIPYEYFLSQNSELRRLTAELNNV